MLPENTIVRLAAPLAGRLLVTGLVALHSIFAFYGNIATNYDFVISGQWRAEKDIVEVFDFIVVGGGSAGAAVANRLSKNSRVLLLEFGGNPNPASNFPASQGLLQQFPSTAFLYATEPQEQAALAMIDKKVLWPRGIGLGGSSSINGAMYQRGNPKDYDNWANITGDPSWAFDNVLKYFKKLEDYHGDYPNSKLHGTGGPITVEKDRLRTLEKEWFHAALEKGYKIKNSKLEQEGFGTNQFTSRNGIRCSTYLGYIKPILKRENLKIYRYSRVIKVHLDKHKHAYGVTYLRHGEQRFVRASKEIIVSAGSIDSPKLLMLSGVGPKHHLNATGIKTRVNLPVGKNLQDHLITFLGPFILKGAKSITVPRMARLDTVTGWFKYPKEGFFASGMLSVTAFISTNARNEPGWADIQYTPLAVGMHPGIDEFAKIIFNIKPEIVRDYVQDYGNQILDGTFSLIGLQRPKSVGTVTLASRDPFASPLMQPNYYSHPDDVKSMVEGVRRMVDLIENTTAFGQYNGHLIPHQLPPCRHHAPKSDKYFECYVRHITATTYHPTSTVPMGKDLHDKRAVLDSKLRVFKTTGLRVIDASIMPLIVNANPNIPTIMIGEIGSDFIREYWQEQYAVCYWKEYVFLYLQVSNTCFYTKIL